MNIFGNKGITSRRKYFAAPMIRNMTLRKFEVYCANAAKNFTVLAHDFDVNADSLTVEFFDVPNWRGDALSIAFFSNVTSVAECVE